MGKLVFNTEEVKRVVEHAINNQGQLLLVKDQGIYLMSDAKPADMIDEGKHFVTYAEGCNPDTNEEWYDTAVNLAGGDDFGETLPFAEVIKQQCDNNAREITIVLTNDKIKLGNFKGQQKPSEQQQTIAEVKPAQQIKDMFQNLIEQGKLNDEVMNIFLSVENSKEKCGVR